MGILHLNDSNFDAEVVKSKQPVLVDFWAEWCAPCKRVAPVIDEIAKEYEGKIKVAKINVDEGRKTAGNFGIMSIPTLILFKGGKVAKQSTGVVSKSELKKIIDNNI